MTHRIEQLRWRRAVSSRWATVLLTVLLAACAPQLVPPGPAISEPEITSDGLRTPDGITLAWREWIADQRAPRAIILALHGFNDYGTFIEKSAAFLNGDGISVYSYDQRGFGASPNRGRWPGAHAFADDLRVATNLLRRRHPQTPLYLLGASMGGAVIMTAMTAANAPNVDGVILAAPAVWGRETQPFYQRWALWLSAHSVPWFTVTGRGLNIRPSDNIPMLRALGKDPLVIKETRIDTIWGLVNLMDAGLAAAPKFDTRALILYGDSDEIIKQRPTELMLSRLPTSAKSRQRLIRYPKGYHMLLRDLQGETVWRDIAAWIENTDGPLPSETAARQQ